MFRMGWDQEQEWQVVAPAGGTLQDLGFDSQVLGEAWSLEQEGAAAGLPPGCQVWGDLRGAEGGRRPRDSWAEAGGTPGDPVPHSRPCPRAGDYALGKRPWVLGHLQVASSLSTGGGLIRRPYKGCPALRKLPESRQPGLAPGRVHGRSLTAQMRSRVLKAFGVPKFKE